VESDEIWWEDLCSVVDYGCQLRRFRILGVGLQLCCCRLLYSGCQKRC